MNRKFLIIALAVVCLTGFTGCAGAWVDAQPGDVTYVRPGAPGDGYVWIDGDWVWGGGSYRWHEGHWGQPRAGRAWVGGSWGHGSRGYRWNRGHWR